MKPRVIESKRYIAVLGRIALIVAVGDWLTKAVAVRFVGSDALVFTERLRFAVMHNDGTAFGLSAGAITWQLNLALTLAAIALMLPVARDLARIDDAAPRALGLIVGGALGNLASLVLGPPGVVDFISVTVDSHSDFVLNVADIAAYVGLAMLVRTGFLLVSEIRRNAQPRRTVQVNHWATIAHRRGLLEREVPIPVPVADRPIVESDLVVPRPESVRRVERLDLVVQDPKVIDIRPHLSRIESRIPSYFEFQRSVARNRAD